MGNLFAVSEKSANFAAVSEEKFRAADALAFISHFTEKVWKTSFGLVRIKKQRDGLDTGLFSQRALALRTPLAWSILISVVRGSKVFQTCP